MWLTRCPQYLTSALRQAAGISCLDRHTTYISTFSTKYDDEDDGYLFFCKKTDDIFIIIFHGPRLVFLWFQLGFPLFQVGFSLFRVGFPLFHVRVSGFQAGFHFFTVPCSFSSFQVGFYGYSWFQVVFVWFQLGFYGCYWLVYIWAERQRREVRRWEHPKRYSLHLYLGPTIPLGLAGRRPALA